MPLKFPLPPHPVQGCDAPRVATYIGVLQDGAAQTMANIPSLTSLRLIELGCFELLCAESDTDVKLLKELASGLSDSILPEAGLRARALLIARIHAGEPERASKKLAKIHELLAAHPFDINGQAIILSTLHRVWSLVDQARAAEVWSSLKALLPRVSGEPAWSCLLRDATARGGVGALIIEAPALLDQLPIERLQSELQPALLAEPDSARALTSLRKALRVSTIHPGHTSALALAGRADAGWLDKLKELPDDAVRARSWGRSALIVFDAHLSSDRGGAMVLLPSLIELSTCRFTETFGAQALFLTRLAARIDEDQRPELLGRVFRLINKMPRKTYGFDEDALGLLGALAALGEWDIAYDVLALLKSSLLERALALLAASYAALGDHRGALVLLEPIDNGLTKSQGALDCLIASRPAT
jgi:hypothetical protein